MKNRMTSVTFAAILATMLAACAGLLGPRNLELSLARLQQEMGDNFPFRSRYLEIFDIHVSNPKLTLQPETNRVLTTVDTSILPTFLEQPWNGTFTLSGRLEIDPRRRALMLAEPRMESFNIHGLESRYARYIARIGTLLAEETLRNVPLYTFSPDEFRYGGSNFLPTRITTRQNSLVVTFEPVK